MGWKDAPLVDDEEKEQPFWMNAPVVAPEPGKSSGKPYLQNLGEFWTKDIPESVKGLGKRTVERAARVEKPTVLGSMAQKATGAKGLPGQIIEGIAGTPERIGRTIGGAAGTLGDITGTGLEITTKGIDNWSGNNISKVTKPIGEMATNAIAGNKHVQDVMKWYNSLPEAEKANYGSAVDMLELVGGYGGGKTATKGIEKTLGRAGDISEQAGKKTLRSGMKIKDTTAKLAGKNVDKGVEKIVNDIAKYKIGSTKGGYKGIANNAQKEISKRMAQTDELIKAYMKEDPIAGVNVTNVLDDLANDIRGGAIKSFMTKEDEAADFIMAVNNSLEKWGRHGYQRIGDIPDIKREISEGLNLFSKGKFTINDAPLKEKVGDYIYLRLLDEVGNRLPGVKKAGKEIHDLINVKNAALEANKRVGNKNVIGLTDVIGLVGGAPALQAIGVPGSYSTIVPLISAGIIGKKALGNGRGASGLLTSKHVLKAASDATKTATPAVGIGTLGATSNLLNNIKARKSKD